MERTVGIAVAGLTLAAMRVVAQDAAAEPQGAHRFTLNDIDGQPAPLSQYRGQVLLVVNVASRCGFTKQYAELQTLHERFQERGFAVLGVPCNDFGGQEPGTEAEIKEFCTAKFGVSFPMFSKVAIRGAEPHPLYAWLTDKNAHPELGGAVGWNFTKFLIGRDGQLLNRFGSRTTPLDGRLTAAVEEALTAPAPE